MKRNVWVTVLIVLNSMRDLVDRYHKEPYEIRSTDGTKREGKLYFKKTRYFSVMCKSFSKFSAGCTLSSSYWSISGFYMQEALLDA